MGLWMPPEMAHFALLLQGHERGSLPLTLDHYTSYRPLVLALRTLELRLAMALRLPVQWSLPLRSLHAIPLTHGTPLVSSSF